MKATARQWCMREHWCLKAPGHAGECHETDEERDARIRAQARRDHPFEGDGEYCRSMRTGRPIGDPATTGTITISVQCGYPREHHPS